MPISPDLQNKILIGRTVVDAYRLAHEQLHAQKWDKFVPDKHTALWVQMMLELKRRGFKTISEFFTASQDLTAQQISLGEITADIAWR